MSGHWVQVVPELSERELDAAVAERVMGWKRLTDGEAYPNTYDQVYPMAREAGIDRSRVTGWWFDPQRRNNQGEAEGMHPDEDSEDCARFAPSTSMGSAMEVVEKMRGQGYQVFIGTCETGLQWQVNFDLWNHGVLYSRNQFQRRSDSLPEAICRAALAAVSTQRNWRAMKFVAKDDTPEMRRVAEVATEILNMPQLVEQVNTETQEELVRQLIEGREPSEGIPDVRPRYPRFDSERQSGE